MKSSTKIELSIIIVNYNVRYFLEQCILSVQDACKNINAEIIIVDNNSHDDSCKMITRFLDSARNDIAIKLIANTKNTGFSTANNQGVAVAKGEYILILNPDTVVAEDTFDKILKFARTKTNLGALGVKLIDGKGHFLPESKRGIPTPKVSFNKLLGISSKHTGKYYATHIDENETGVIEILVGAFMFMKRKIYNEVKGFDEDYFMYGEDIDLSYKILKKGYQNFYFPEVQTVHYKGESTKKDVKYLRYFYGAMNIFYKKHFKLNIIYDFLMSFGIQFWYVIKYFKLKTVESTKEKNYNFIYLGGNPSTFVKLKTKINPKLAIHHTKISIDDIEVNKVELIIFDNNYLSNKEIINAIKTLQKNDYSFRIIPRSCSFYIGSDTSVGRGIVTSF